MSRGQIMPGCIGYIKDLGFYSVMRTHWQMLGRHTVGFMSVESQYYI